MRYFLIIFIIGICACREVKLAGTSYVTEPDFGGTIYHFTSDSTFEMRGWSCMVNDTGRGHYRLTRDSLIFYFDSLNAKEQLVTVTPSISHGDSCTIRINCRDDSSALAYAIVLVKPALSPSRMLVTDIIGTTTLTLAKTDFPVQFDFYYTGYAGLRMSIPSPADYTLDVQLKRSALLVMAPGEVHAYKLKKLSSRKIKLEFDYTDVEEKRRTARRELLRVKK